MHAKSNYYDFNYTHLIITRPEFDVGIYIVIFHDELIYSSLNNLLIYLTFATPKTDSYRAAYMYT